MKINNAKIGQIIKVCGHPKFFKRVKPGQDWIPTESCHIAKFDITYGHMNRKYWN